MGVYEGSLARETLIHNGAEGVGFEPTVPFDTTVFETVRFVRSRIPPANRLVAAQSLKEPRKQLAGIFLQHACNNHGFMV